ncbi:HAD-IB family hydrolase [Streptomyces sp. NPDC046316]|uniref:HAD family hydrolase n=1 Tax=Streptomyces sp. NPDC046316 TaxID=3154494 RepID=UPI0033F73953
MAARLVFTDVDETLIKPKSVFDFLEFYFTGRHGDAGVRHTRATRQRLGRLQAAGAGRDEANRAYYEAWRGQRAEEVAEWGRRWFDERLQGGDFYVPRTRAALRRHQREGAVLVLVSGAFDAVLAPIAGDVGAVHVRGTRPQVCRGVYTGAVIGAPVIGEGKREVVRAVLRAYPHIGAGDCYAYGDHLSDLPMLTEVGRPVVVGASQDLLAALPDADTLPY